LALIRSSAAVLAVLVALLAAAPARAHSLLLASSPPANATVPAAPPHVTLRFNNRIEKRLCRIRLVDAHGAARTLAVQVAGGAPDELSAPVPALDPGAYRVDWRVLSTDGHVVDGAFSFRVAP
jgi:copper resistance protein C